MKSLFALFAVTAFLGVAAIAAPASAAPGDLKWKCDWTQDREDQKDCVCVAEAREKKWVDGRLLWIASWRPAICPANGGGSSSSSSDEPSTPDDKPHKKHQKSVSKAESESSVVSVGTVLFRTPLAVTVQHQENSAFATGNGSAGAGADTDGGALAISGGSFSGGAGWGSTGGSTCAGEAC